MKFLFFEATSFLSLLLSAVADKPVLRGSNGYQPYGNNQDNGYNGGYTPYGNQNNENNQNNQNQDRNQNQDGENASDCGPGMCQGEDGYGPCVYSCPDVQGPSGTDIVSFYERSGDNCRECDSVIA